MKVTLLFILSILFFGCTEDDDTNLALNDIEIVNASFTIGSINGQDVVFSGVQNYCQDGVTQQILEGGSRGDDFYNRFGNRMLNVGESISAIATTIAIGNYEQLQEGDNTSLIGTAIRYNEGRAIEEFYLQFEFKFSDIIYSTFLLNQINLSESVKDINSESDLNVVLDEDIYCGSSGQIITYEWNYTGYAYSKLDRLDSIHIENVLIEIHNGY